MQYLVRLVTLQAVLFRSVLQVQAYATSSLNGRLDSIGIELNPDIAKCTCAFISPHANGNVLGGKICCENPFDGLATLCDKKFEEGWTILLKNG